MPMHGLANRYSSAVAVFLNKGESEEKALQLAKEYVNAQVVKAEGWQGRSSKLYNDFIDALEQHVRTNSDVHYYANRLNVSSRYLAQVTKRISGKAPKTIIDDRLIQEIELQLHTTDKTVQEIAYSCGFSSQAHFTKFFKKMKNISPTKFRKL
jgi:hydroxymethylpyrimidine/phosphomethylpyrimidine kinase